MFLQKLGTLIPDSTALRHKIVLFIVLYIKIRLVFNLEMFATIHFQIFRLLVSLFET
jgi:hypothetical protein